MATTIINPAPNINASNNGVGFLVGVIVLVIFAVIFFIYALPYIRGFGSGGVQINVPKSINVKVQQTK